MFKNLRVYRVGAGWSAGVSEAEAGLQGAVFAPCAATQAVSVGWVAPRGVGHAALVEVVGGQWLAELRTEQRVLPAAVLRRRTDELAARVEHDTGRKPGKRQAKELKEAALLELLPGAFTRQMAVRVWLNPAQRLLMLDAASPARADDAITQLVKALPGIGLAPLHTAQSPAAAMAQWLTFGEPPAGFTIDRECELKAADETKAVVRYARHALDIDEVRQHIAAGKQPTRLALTWQGRVSLLLTDGLQLKKIEFLDGVFEAGPRNADDTFDADVSIATGELARLIPDLIDALGGEALPGLQALAA